MSRLTRALLLSLALLVAAGVSGDPSPPQVPDRQDDIEDFVPTQKLSADEAVAFPSDI
jgi:hypothetical protein